MSWCEKKLPLIWQALMMVLVEAAEAELLLVCYVWYKQCHGRSARRHVHMH